MKSLYSAAGQGRRVDCHSSLREYLDRGVPCIHLQLFPRNKLFDSNVIHTGDRDDDTPQRRDGLASDISWPE
jgi:hypothetical protein